MSLILPNKSLATGQLAERLFAAPMKREDGYAIARFMEFITS